MQSLRNRLSQFLTRRQVTPEHEDVEIQGTASNVEPKTSQGSNFSQTLSPRELPPRRSRVNSMFRGFFRVSSGSRLARKLYGSKKAVIEEQDRQRKAGHWVIHPLSNFR